MLCFIPHTPKQWPIFTKVSTFFLGPDEQHEIQRQNRITEQILTNFFERKFFPNRKPKPAPTIDEILPPESRANPSIRNKHSTQKENDDDETDNLQSVESEHVDSFYRDYSEGRWKYLEGVEVGKKKMGLSIKLSALCTFRSWCKFKVVYMSLKNFLIWPWQTLQTVPS